MGEQPSLLPEETLRLQGRGADKRTAMTKKKKKKEDQGVVTGHLCRLLAQISLNPVGFDLWPSYGALRFFASQRLSARGCSSAWSLFEAEAPSSITHRSPNSRSASSPFTILSFFSPSLKSCRSLIQTKPLTAPTFVLTRRPYKHPYYQPSGCYPYPISTVLVSYSSFASSSMP